MNAPVEMVTKQDALKVGLLAYMEGRAAGAEDGLEVATVQEVREKVCAVFNRVVFGTENPE